MDVEQTNENVIKSHIDNRIRGQTLGSHYTGLDVVQAHFSYPCHITRRMARALKFQHNTTISSTQYVSQVGEVY